MSLILCSYTKLGTVDLMKLFKYSFRYMDTYIFWIAGTHYNSLILTLKEFHPIPFGYVLWTSSIEIKMETDRISIVFLQQGTNAHFMNIQISIINEKDGLFWTQHFDKRRNLPFQYAQFLQFRCNRSIFEPYNIIQYHTISSIPDYILVKERTWCCEWFRTFATSSNGEWIPMT